MASYKVVISDPASKKAYQKEVDQAQSGLNGKKIGEKVPGSGLGLEGYELEITGGSDKDGFPMRADVNGSVRKKIILTSPPGYHPEHDGKRKRKSVRGNTISQDISQINIKVVKTGSKKLEELMGKKKEEKKDDNAAEGKKKEDAKPAEKPAETRKEEKPAESKEAKKADEEKGSQDKSNQAAKADAKMGVKPLEEKEKEAEKK